MDNRATLNAFEGEIGQYLLGQHFLGNISWGYTNPIPCKRIDLSWAFPTCMSFGIYKTSVSYFVATTS